ncbi:MAG: SBBP repeat-containing protein [Anaerolineae bacterium]|nr:SBBP repeat-containing protein [Anaerolineae bacterium]MCI0608495.1 SBBP repeat-containing protein [Anaerolineae bacterium]
MKILPTKFLYVIICASMLIALAGNQSVYAEGIAIMRNVPAYHGDTNVSHDRIHALPLSIDPALIWNTFLGGSSYDEGDDIVVDNSGNVYVTGYSDVSWGNPIRPFSTIPDAFVAKLDSSGNLMWNTFLGGSGGDLGYGIALDTSGNVYVTGNSDVTWGSPIRAYTTGISDAFIAKLNTSGNLIWNTFLGGSGMDEAREIAIGGSGNVYVTGRSDSTWGGSIIRAYTADMDAYVANVDTNGSWGNPIRAYTAFKDVFVTKLNSDGNLTWNTFLGGSGNDEGFNIALDGSGNTYVTGYSTTTWENPIRAFTAAEDAFVAKIDTGGSLIWNTFLGGSASDQATGIDTDGTGNVYVTGYSSGSWGNPVRAFTAGNDAFAAKMETGGNLMWNTFLGGNGQDYGYGINVDGNGNAYVTGPSNVAWETPIRAYTADMDAFVAKLGIPPLVVSTSLTSVMNPGPSSFTVTFSEGVNNPAGNTNTDDATNPNNYILINKGTNGIADTTSCAGGVVTDDTRVTITSVTHNSVTLTSRVTLTGILPAGKYRLFVCGTTSIVDFGSTALAGDGTTSGTDYIFDFSVNTVTTLPLPDTGFTPNTVTSLPSQPMHKAYSFLGDIWLEIPTQNIRIDIVGVPQSDQGWDVTWLGNNIGWLHGTAFPSWEGNSVLTGHVYSPNGLPGPFLNIKNLKYGDNIIVHLYGQKHIFEVQSTRFSRPTSTGFALKHLEDRSYLTLITCQGYNPLSDSYLFRRIVRAVLVDVQSE